MFRKNGKLKTINAFSLGGLNFKGFDYRGIGKFDENIYLGGNKLMTSTIGYGGDFIFDESDNINYKLFYYFNDYFSIFKFYLLSLWFLIKLYEMEKNLRSQMIQTIYFLIN
mgnify:CR=1 FL=1